MHRCMHVSYEGVTASSRNSDSTDSCEDSSTAALCTAATAPPTALWKRGAADDDSGSVSLGAA
jgi:hypothetical protein